MPWRAAWILTLRASLIIFADYSRAWKTGIINSNKFFGEAAVRFSAFAAVAVFAGFALSSKPATK
jgi:hypothetical protein